MEHQSYGSLDGWNLGDMGTAMFKRSAAFLFFWIEDWIILCNYIFVLGKKTIKFFLALSLGFLREHPAVI